MRLIGTAILGAVLLAFATGCDEASLPDAAKALLTTQSLTDQVSGECTGLMEQVRAQTRAMDGTGEGEQYQYRWQLRHEGQAAGGFQYRHGASE